MKHARVIPVILALGIALTTAVAQQAPTVAPSAIVGLTPQDALALANRWSRQAAAGLAVSLTNRELRFKFPDGESRVVALPSDRMVLAIAPYISRTHACVDHVITGCQGELSDAEVTVRARTSDGQIVLDTATKTLPNGFVELWLPRDHTVNLEIEAQGLKAVATLGTGPSAQTCITTLQLRPDRA